MYRIILNISSIIIMLAWLSSCKPIEAITIANNSIYYDEEAIIANDIYNELYEEKLMDKKPIMIKNKKEK